MVNIRLWRSARLLCTVSVLCSNSLINVLLWNIVEATLSQPLKWSRLLTVWIARPVNTAGLLMLMLACTREVKCVIYSKHWTYYPECLWNDVTLRLIHLLTFLCLFFALTCVVGAVTAAEVRHECEPGDCGQWPSHSGHGWIRPHGPVLAGTQRDLHQDGPAPGLCILPERKKNNSHVITPRNTIKRAVFCTYSYPKVFYVLTCQWLTCGEISCLWHQNYDCPSHVDTYAKHNVYLFGNKKWIQVSQAQFPVMPLHRWSNFLIS